MADAWSDQGSINSSAKSCHIAHKIYISDEPAPSLDLDELVDKAYKCPVQFRKRDMLETIIVEKTIKGDNAKAPGPDCDIPRRHSRP